MTFGPLLNRGLVARRTNHVNRGCWFKNSGISPVRLSDTGPYTQRERRDQRKRQTSPDWKVAGVISKGTYLQGLSWAAARWVGLCTPPGKILKVFIEALTGFIHIFSSGSLNSTLFSQGCILEMTPSAGTVGRMSIPRIGEWRSMWLPGSNSQVNWRSCLLDDLQWRVGIFRPTP